MVSPGREEKDYSEECYLTLGRPENFEKDNNYTYYINKRKSHAKKVLEGLKSAKIDKESEMKNLTKFLEDVEKYYA